MAKIEETTKVRRASKQERNRANRKDLPCILALFVDRPLERTAAERPFSMVQAAITFFDSAWEVLSKLTSAPAAKQEWRPKVAETLPQLFQGQFVRTTHVESQLCSRRGPSHAKGASCEFRGPPQQNQQSHRKHTSARKQQVEA